MAPNSTLIRDYSTYGDLSQRDVYHRHKTQVIKEGAVENYFYHIDSGDVEVNTVVEKVSFSEGASKYEVYTKPSSGSLTNTENNSMIEITNAKTTIRSLEFQAAGNVSLGNLAVTGALSTTGPASIGGNLTVSGNTSMTNVTASGTLDVTGGTTLSTLDTSGLATLNAATIVGNTSMSHFTASGTGNVTGTLDVTGTTTLSTLTTSGLATLNAATVVGNTSMSSFTASGGGDVTGTFGVTGDAFFGNIAVSGTGTVDTLNVSGTSVFTGVTTHTGNLVVVGTTDLTNVNVTGTQTVSGTMNVTGTSYLANTTITLGEDGALTVTGNGNVDLGNNDITSTGNVTFTGLTSISNLSLSGSSGFGGDLNVGNNNVINVATMTRDNVRVALDNTARAIYAQTFSDTEWSTTTTTTNSEFQVDKDLIVTGISTMNGNVIMQGANVEVGNTTTATPLTVYGPTNIQNTLAVTDDSTLVNVFLTGNLDMQNNQIVGANTIIGGTQNTRIRFRDDGTPELSLETFSGGVWSATSTMSTNTLEANKTLSVTSTATLQSNVVMSGPSSSTVSIPNSDVIITCKDVTMGNVTSPTNLTVWGNLDAKSDTTLTTLSTSGLATLNAATVTGATSLNSFTASGTGSVTGTLDVTGATTLTTLTTSGLATLNTATVTGATSLNTFTASGTGSVTGTLGVTGATTLSTLTTSGLATLNTATIVGDTSMNSFTASGNGSITGNLGVTGNTTLSSLALSGNLNMQNNSVHWVENLERDNMRLHMSDDMFRIYYNTAGGTSSGSLGFQMTNNSTQMNRAVTINSTLAVPTSNVTFGGNVIMSGDENTTVTVASSNVIIGCKEVTMGNNTTSTNLTLWGNLDIKGATTNTRIESNLVQVGDLNVELGYLEINNLANLNGGGITLGGPGGSIDTTRPTLTYNSTANAWQPNIDIIAKSDTATDIAKLDTDGFLVSTLVSDANIFTKIDSTTINFGDKWRFKHDTVNDTIELQHYETGNWVSKFTYAA